MSNTARDINSLLKVAVKSVKDESHKTQIEIAFAKHPTAATTGEIYPSRINDQLGTSWLVTQYLGEKVFIHSSIRNWSKSLYDVSSIISHFNNIFQPNI